MNLTWNLIDPKDEELEIEYIKDLLNQGKIDEVSPLITSLIEKIAHECINEILPLYENQFDNPFPEIIMSMKDENAMGYYCNKKIGIIIPAYGRLLSLKLNEGHSPYSCYEILKARMTFTILHEIDHYIYHIENAELKKENKKKTFFTLRILVKQKELNELMECERTKEYILNQSKLHVEEEMHADNFAYSFIEKYFSEIYSQPDFIEFKNKRPLIYRNYTVDKIVILIYRHINHIPLEDKKILAKHYMKIALNL